MQYLVDLGILLPADDLTMDTTIEEETLSYSPSSSQSSPWEAFLKAFIEY